MTDALPGSSEYAAGCCIARLRLNPKWGAQSLCQFEHHRHGVEHAAGNARRLYDRAVSLDFFIDHEALPEA